MKTFLFFIGLILTTICVAQAADCDFADWSADAQNLVNKCFEDDFTTFKCDDGCENALENYFENFEECYDAIIDEIGNIDDDAAKQAQQAILDGIKLSIQNIENFCEFIEDGFEILSCLSDYTKEINDYAENCQSNDFCSDKCIDSWKKIQKALYKDCLDSDDGYKAYLGYLESICVLDRPEEVCSAKAGKLMMELREECLDEDGFDEEGCSEDCSDIIDELKAENCDLANTLVGQFEPLCKSCSADVYAKAQAIEYVCDAAFDNTENPTQCPEDCDDAVDEFNQAVKDCFEEDSFPYNVAMDLTSQYDKFCDNLLSSDAGDRYCAMEKGLDKFEDLVHTCTGLAQKCSQDCFEAIEALVDDVKEECGKTVFDDLFKVVGCHSDRKLISLSFKDLVCDDIFDDYYEFLKKLGVALDTDWFDIVITNLDCDGKKRQSDTELTCENCQDAKSEDFEDAGLTLDEEPETVKPSGDSGDGGDDGDDDSASMIFLSLSAIIASIIAYLF